jgi:FkbM family methyltransferase
MKKSEIVMIVSMRVPALARLAVWVCVGVARLFSRYSIVDHWLVVKIAGTLGYRMPVWTKLGNGLKIRVARNDMIGRRICERGYYEPETVRLIEQIVDEGSVFFDVGAHVGQYTLVASQRVGTRGSVHSFEPDPHTFAWLADNVRANQLANVTTNQSAVAADREPKQLYFSTVDDIGSNSLALQGARQRTGRSMLVACTTLDAYVTDKRIPRVDVIKADVEGAELSMLLGATAILGGPRPPILILEFEEERQVAFGSSCGRLAEELQRYGYDLWRIGQFLEPYRPRPDDPWSLNILAVHPSRRAILQRLQVAR